MSPTASSWVLLTLEGRNEMEVTGVETRNRFKLGFVVWSTMSHTSMVPSARPTNTTAGRVGDQHPVVSSTGQRGAVNRGCFMPSSHRLKE